MNCFFIFLKLFLKYDIIKSVKGNKKGVFLEEKFFVLSIGGASKETNYEKSRTFLKNFK